MKVAIPMHLHTDIADNGIHIKIVTSENIGYHPIEYAHRDDYYIFGLITRGILCIEIDFEKHTVEEREIGLIRPGQIHRYINGEHFEGLMLSVESSIVSDQYKLIFEEASFSCKAIEVPDTETGELKVLYQ